MGGRSLCCLHSRGGWPWAHKPAAAVLELAPPRRCAAGAAETQSAVPWSPEASPHLGPPTPLPKHPSCGQDSVLQKARFIGTQAACQGPTHCAWEEHETLCQPWPAGTGAQAASLPTSPLQGPGPSPPLPEGHSGPLEIEPLGGAFLFFIKNVFLGLLEVFVGHFHPALSQGHQTSFCADCLYGRTVYSEWEILPILTVQTALF